MVAGAIVAIGTLALLIFFNKDIGNFLREFKPTAVIADVGKGINQAGKDAGAQVGTTIIRPVSIFFKERELESQAKSEGFKPRVVTVNGVKQTLTAKQEKELAIDAGDFVIGGSQKVVQFGIIGDILPSDPSPFFIANAEKLLTVKQLEKFKIQQGTAPLGGQTAIGTNTVKTIGNNIDPIEKTTSLFTNFGESFQKTITGGSLFSELF